jgi:hypothetical protein
MRTGPPIDDEEDLDRSTWAGVVPLTTVPGAPIPAPDLRSDAEVPAYAARYRRPRAVSE